MTSLRITHTSTVTSDQIDHLGHMNVRYYAVNARAATRAVLADLGVPRTRDVDIVDMYTRHHHEQLLGTELVVRSGILGVDSTSIRIYHELADAATGDLPATFVYRVRSDIPIDHVATVELPRHGEPRSIDIEARPSHPTLDTVRELGLAMRAPRVLDDSELDDSGTVSPHMVPMLIWGGTTPDGADFQLTHEGPNGESIGWATMETRIGIVRLPGRETRIQSFGATTAVADKTTAMSMWAYDLDTGEVLVTFEVVSLLFNIDARSAMSIPDTMRAEHLANLHPELGSRRPTG